MLKILQIAVLSTLGALAWCIRGPSAFAEDNHVTSVSAGRANTCALLSNQTIKCLGWNSDGSLGQGDTLDRGGDPNTVPALLPYVEL